jgi:hypothetical protein
MDDNLSRVSCQSILLFFLLQGTLTVALAGRWGLDFTSSGQLQRADAVDGDTDRCSGACRRAACRGTAGWTAARPVWRRHVPRHVVHRRAPSPRTGRPGARPPRPGRGRAARRRRALLRPSALIDRQVQGRVVCLMKACVRASKVFWFISSRDVIYSMTDQRMLNWTPALS